MTVQQAIDILSKLDPTHSLLGQYHDSSGLWPTGVVYIEKLPGNNSLVTVQVLHGEDLR